MRRREPRAPKASEPVRARKAMELSIRDLYRDAPFFGALAMNLELVEDYTCETAWTDGVSLGYNPTFVLSLQRVVRKGLTAHEVVHVMLRHMSRRRWRDPELWNEACDFAVNLILKANGFFLPDGVLYDLKYTGMPAEIIYRLRFTDMPPPTGKSKPGEQGQPTGQEQGESQPASTEQPDEKSPETEGQDAEDRASQGDQDGAGSAGDKASQDGTSSGRNGAQDGKPVKRIPWGEVRDAPANVDRARIDAKWAVAAERARTIAVARGNMPGSLESLVEAAKEPQIDWKETLWHLVEQCRACDDYSWRVPDANYMRMGLYVPTLSGFTMPPVVFIKDTSGSHDVKSVGEMHTEVECIAATLEPEVTYVVDADARVANVQEIYPGERIKPTAKGRCGTDYRPAFEWVKKQGIYPSVLIYMGDMDAIFPEEEPDYPVIWVMTTHTKPAVSWGHRLQLPM